MSLPTLPITITPKEEVVSYAHLIVPLVNGMYRVAITKYRTDEEERINADGGAKEGKVYKDWLLRHYPVLERVSRTDFMSFFVGKASRRAIISVLQALDGLNALDASGDKQTVLQQFCDTYCGLDCNGFVGNWARDNLLTSIEPNTWPKTMTERFASSRRNSVEEIQPYDIITWDNVHVAAVEALGPVEDGRRQVWIAEASDDINCTEYRVNGRDAEPGRFDITGHGFGVAEFYGIGLLPRVFHAATHAFSGRSEAT